MGNSYFKVRYSHIANGKKELVEECFLTEDEVKQYLKDTEEINWAVIYQIIDGVESNQFYLVEVERDD